MTTRADDGHRRLVPRWRYSGRTILGREHEGDPKAKRRSAPVASNITALHQEWQRAHDSQSARELVLAAVVEERADLAREAAEQILANPRETAREVIGAARFVLGDRAMSQPHAAANIKTSFEQPFKQARRVIALGRQGLREYPRNVPRRLDVARAYAVLGQNDAAWREMRIALALAPDHRVVLRLAVRLLVHLDRREEAHALIVRHPRTSVDPWLMATEIALATIIEETPHSIRAGRLVVAESGLPSGHLTELASSLGSVDSGSGDHKRARKLHGLSLQDPNDNVLAQAEWLAQRDYALRKRLTDARIELPGSMEAQCHRAVSESRWIDALGHAYEWHHDEPFSSRPTTAASFIAASILQEYTEAIAIAKAGLRGDPDDALLLNNLIFALARAGRAPEAARHLERFATLRRSRVNEFVYVATRGLVAFETGNPAAGRLDYMEAVRLAQDRANRLQVLASWGETELHHQTALADELYRRVITAREGVTDPAALAVADAFARTYSLVRSARALGHAPDGLSTTARLPISAAEET